MQITKRMRELDGRIENMTKRKLFSRCVNGGGWILCRVLNVGTGIIGAIQFTFDFIEMLQFCTFVASNQWIVYYSLNKASLINFTKR